MVAQVDRTELRERGVSWGVVGTQFGISSIVGGLATSNTAANLFTAGGAAGVPPITTGATANIVAGIVPAGTVGAIRALKTDGVAKFLSEPRVVTQTGRPATLRAGGQQAILGQSSGINGPGVTLEQVGTNVEVLPIVFGNGKIYLEVTPSFRSVNAGRGVTTAFGFTPGFNESSARSSIMLESGQTFAIGGLLEMQTQNTAEKVPYIGDLPIIGAAFSSVRSEDRETELLILVTPRLVDALDCNQVPKRVPGRETRIPDDYEFFLESLVEAPRGQRRVWNGRCYVPAYKNDPSNALFPCNGPNCGTPVGCANGSCAAPGIATVGSAPTAMPVVPVGGESPMPVSVPEPAPISK
jgi:pilus assembly protein CpaC